MLSWSTSAKGLSEKYTRFGFELKSLSISFNINIIIIIIITLKGSEKKYWFLRSNEVY